MFCNVRLECHGRDWFVFFHFHLLFFNVLFSCLDFGMPNFDLVLIGMFESHLLTIHSPFVSCVLRFVCFHLCMIATFMLEFVTFFQLEMRDCSC